jgi:hypothetical protein
MTESYSAMASLPESIGAAGRPVLTRPAPAKVSPLPHLGEQAAGSYWRPAVGVFLAVAGMFWWALADRLSLPTDEGIYLEGARRMLEGQAPYRDFFIHTGPGSLLWHALLFKLLGVSLSHGHVVLILDLAFLSAAVFWLTAQLTRPLAAAIATFLFVAFETSNPSMVGVNHRWDSCALAVGATMLLFVWLERPRWWLLTGAGALAALGAWATPSVGVVVAALGAWLLLNPGRGRSLAAYTGGVALGCAGPVIVLGREGALVPMVRHLLWTGSNYPNAHGFSYGWIIGGYGGVLAGSSGLELAIRVVLLAIIALPVYLPLLVFAGWTVRLWKDNGLGSLERRRIQFLLVAAVGLWLSAYPWYLGHLTWVAALSYVLAAALFRGPLRGARFAGLVFLLLAGLTFFWRTVQATSDPTMETRVGRVRASSEDLLLLQAVSQYVHAGDTLFVYPYKPILYFLTRAANPYRYLWLQPGMMNDQDEAIALADLESRPPRWIVYQDLAPEAYLRIWPHSDPKKLRMWQVENFIHSRYRLVSEQGNSPGRFQIRELLTEPRELQTQPEAPRP